VATSTSRRIYILHFDRPFSHAKHYVGSADNVSLRVLEHATGRGANLMRHVVGAGIGFIVSCTFPGTRGDERIMKKRWKDVAKRRCPVCSGKLTYDQAKRRYRSNRVLENLFSKKRSE